MEKKKIGFIGYKGHATRLINIFDELDKCEIVFFYHPEKDIDIDQLSLKDKRKVFATKKLSDLYKCDGLVICTPNYTHFNYLKTLVENYKGYIFCEKPPVTKRKELEALIKFSNTDKKRIHFNFNMRFSALFGILKTSPQKYNLGKPIRISVVAGHGLGFKESYGRSWRAKAGIHKGGVFETLGIHYFDLISFLFGPPVDCFYKVKTYSPYGDSIDTCHLSCSFTNGCFFNLTSSYCMPFVENMQINYTNGHISFDAGKIKVFGPRETFDKHGFFIQPPIIYEANLNSDLLYFESLRNSCSYFIDCICKKRAIAVKYFKQSISTNKMCLSIS